MFRLTTLGATDLRDRHGHPMRELLAQPKRVALLVYLAVEGTRSPVSRDRLLALFWPESDTARARNALSQTLHVLRQALGPDVIESQGASTIRLHPGALWCDATALKEALDRGEVELALDLYRGEFCPTLFVSGTPEVEQWLDSHRRQLRRHALSAAQAHAERLAAKQEWGDAARAARRALALTPDNEADVRALLSILERSGDVTGALLAFQEYERQLAADLETEPATETRKLVEAIRHRREIASTPSVSAPAPGTPGASGTHPLPPESAGTVRTRPAHGRTVVVAGLVLATLIVVGVIALKSGRTATAPSAVRTLAVFPFDLRGGSLGYLREGMVDLLSAKLDGVAGLRAVDPRSVVAAVAAEGDTLGPESRIRIARRLGAAWYVTGEVVEVAGRLQLNAALHDVNAPGRTPAVRATVSGDTTALFDLVDDLTGQTLANLLAGRDTALTRLAALTTHSLPALKAFLEGEQALRAGRDAQAAAAFREAIGLDSSFALAEYRLAVMSTWVTVPGVDNPQTWAAMAASHAQRLSPLVRDLLTAYGAYKQINADVAERLYLSVTQSHPDNVEARFMLAETRFHYGPWLGRDPLESRADFEQVLALDPTNPHAMLHLARLAALDGRVVDLDSLAGRFFERYRDAERMLEIQALQSFVRNEPARWERAATTVARADALVAVSILQAATTYVQNLDAARLLAGLIVRPADPIISASTARFMSDISLAGGQWGEPPVTQAAGTYDVDWQREGRALLAAEPFFNLAPARTSAIRTAVAELRPYRSMAVSAIAPMIPDVGPVVQKYLVALLSIRLGDTAAAIQTVGDLRSTRGDNAPWAEQLAYALQAEIDRSKGDFARALSELEHFRFTILTSDGRSIGHWGARERFLRAELLRALGRETEALSWYGSLQYEMLFMAAAHFRQAQIYQRMGNSERARFHYGRLVSLWKNSDPELQPIVEQARQAMGSPVGQPTATVTSLADPLAAPLAKR